MADIVFNAAKGRVAELARRVVNNDPANSAFVVVLLQTVEADAALADYADLATLLAAAGNSEADFTNYARKVLTDADLTAPTVDNTNDQQRVTIPDQTWASAGGTTDNSLVKMLVCYDPDSTSGADADLVPLVAQDMAAATNGNDLIVRIDANGIFVAA